MLVLTRKRMQTIVVDDRITITIVHVGGKGVRVGIEAPPEVSIRRGELKPIGLAEEHRAA